jgi:hypothetical protein
MLTFKQFLLESDESDHHFHYSHKAGLTHLSGHMSGTGIKGAEQERLSQTKDNRIKKRVYFYPPVGGGHLPRPEQGLGHHIYSAKAENLHDATKPSEAANKIAATAKEHEAKGEHPGNAFERAVLDHGFHGYKTSNMHVVMNHDVAVKHHCTTQGKTFADHKFDTSEKKKSVFDGAPNKEGEHTSSNLNQHQSLFYLKHKEALQKAAPSIKMQYGKLNVHKDHLSGLHKELEKHKDHPL